MCGEEKTSPPARATLRTDTDEGWIIRRTGNKTMDAIKKSLKNGSYKKWVFYACLVALPLLQFCIMYVGVNMNSFLMAFKSYDAINDSWDFCGWANFKAVFYDVGRLPALNYAFKNSFVAWGVGLLISTPLGLLFAFYAYKKYWGWGFFRVVLFLPSIISGMVLTIMFRYYADTFLPGVINSVFGTNLYGFLSTPNKGQDFVAILMFNVFIGFGVSVLMYTGAMVSISQSVTEAACLDGVNAFQEFFYIVFPQIISTVGVFLVTGIAGIFTNQLNLYSIRHNEAPEHLFTMGYYIYANIQKAGSSYAVYPYYACLSLLLTLIVAPIILVARYLINKYDPMKA